MTRPARSPQRSGRGKPRAQPGRLPGPIPLLSPSVAKASRHPLLGQALGPAGARRGEAASPRPREQAGPGRGQRLPAVTSGRPADPWPAVTDALFTCVASRLEAGEGFLPPWPLGAGSPVRRGDALAGGVPWGGDREGVGADPRLLCRVEARSWMKSPRSEPLFCLFSCTGPDSSARGPLNKGSESGHMHGARLKHLYTCDTPLALGGRELVIINTLL